MTRAVAERWHGQPCIIAASGPSLDEAVADQCQRARAAHFKIAAVSDAHRLLPFADVLYCSDKLWWEKYCGCPEFRGEKWVAYGNFEIADKYQLQVVRGFNGDRFSLNPNFIHYGCNSGFALINLVLLFGANPIVLVGFNMQTVGGRRHFFGDHPAGLTNTTNYQSWVPIFANAARQLPNNRIILNATPNSALDCFKRVSLEDLL
jgi:hypothetical protein